MSLPAAPRWLPWFTSRGRRRRGQPGRSKSSFRAPRGNGADLAGRLLGQKEVPTIDESGYKGFESVAWFADVAPKGTPADAINRLNQALGESIELPDVREKQQAQGTNPVGGSPADLRQFQDNEIQKWTKVARTARVAL